MRQPYQCEGIDRGLERAINIGVVGSVSPQFWGGLANRGLRGLRAVLDD